jgi:predicted HNH restriction endonuclease
MPIQEGSAVYLDHPYENKTEELDHTVQPKNFVNIRFDAILVPDEALTVRRIEGIGNLRTMYWNIPRSGVRIGPRRNQGFRGDLMPQLEEVWAQHLDGISFPIGDDEEERTISTVLGREGRRMLRVHRFRERWPGLAEAKRTEALARLGNLECQVCGFDFLQKYGPHGDGFMEVHHRTPLMDADPDEGREVSTEDVDLVCANCHRMIHWKELLPLEKLRSYLRP